MDTSVSSAAGRRRRRKHSAEFKAQLVQACEQPGMSSAAIAMANGINANLLRRWVNDAEQRGSTLIAPSPPPLAPPTPEFIPLQLPAPKPQADIRIELQRSGTSVSVVWPVSAAVAGNTQNQDRLAGTCAPCIRHPHGASAPAARSRPQISRA